jgi:selenide, water dikinase
VLRRLPTLSDDRLLTPSGRVEDAAVYLWDSQKVLLFTTDYFTPVVDDPYTFGQIAAANAFSDVYAMGGRPKLALNLMNYPTRTYRTDQMFEILRGGGDKALEAGCLVVGGHTADDPEPKYGMAVIGEANREDLMRKDAAKPGDRLYLTKPLGTGVLVAAFKDRKLDEKDFSQAAESMRTLNRSASEAALEAGVKAATDVTGFGFLGHLLEMCRESEVSAEVRFTALPFFDGVEAHVLADHVPGGSFANLKWVRDSLDVEDDIPEHHVLMAADAQTSGGLLLPVPPEKEAPLVRALQARGQGFWLVGTLAEGPPRIRFLP